jgi:hypothetical protein
LDTTVMLPHGAAPATIREAQFSTKRDALRAARAAGFASDAVQRVSRIGFLVWVVVGPDSKPLTQAHLLGGH